ncbi:MAG: glutathione S-transferase family protein [Pseudomonadales bacterium]|nr:glutathione S-transferase family protein [Pseudomonadales bacterium]
MGLLVEGQWQDKWYDTDKTGGKFVRGESQFRNWVTSDGRPGPTGDGGFGAEPDRYHLYVSLTCPWAHRTLIMRELKGLQEMIPVSVVNWKMLENGWTFEPGPGVIADEVNHASFLHEIYTKADPGYTGRVTVPVLWDKKQNTIVSNESADIVRMFNSAFDDVGARAGDYYPGTLRGEIHLLNETIYHRVNNGVYKAGFATSQSAYEEAFDDLFSTLGWLDNLLGDRRFLLGGQMTEADIRLFTTLIRFDLVYYGHFKCNRYHLYEYPNLWAFTRELYQMSEIRKTVNFHHIKHHYYESHPSINPTGIVPKGPKIDFDAPHDRRRLLALNAA